MSWKEEFWKSIKSYDTEEKLDLYFYRPLGFLIAKIARVLRMTPTQLTLIGLTLGLASGFLFYHNENSKSLVLASILFVMAGVFDSSDGQLARMGGKSTRLGLVLDGLCDNLVFASAYIGCTLTVVSDYGPALWFVLVFAGACHSFQSSMLDFYNREYLYFGNGKYNGDYWNLTLDEARRDRAAAVTSGDRWFWKLRFSWLWQQNKLTTRSSSQRYAMRDLVKGSHSSEFQEEYRKYNRLILRFWRLMGPNFHTIMIIVCVFLRRFDLYIIGVDIIALTATLFVLRLFQWRQDQQLFQSLKSRNLLSAS